MPASLSLSPKTWTPRFDPTRAVAAAKAAPRSRIRDYTSYWRTLRREMPAEAGIHQRYLYSQASVNNAVAGHLLCYRWFLKFRPGFSTGMSEPQFIARLRRAGVGGQFAVRGGGVYRFDRDFTANPTSWAPARPTPAHRDAIASTLHGLGRAKTAFALELIDPMGCTAVCLDRHMLRLYNLAPPTGGAKANDQQYAEAEAHWLQLARERNTSPFILRSVFWDTRVGQDTCRWWSFPFEGWFDPYGWARLSGLGGKW